jgi:trimeric autotransporter adhesin
MRHRLRSRALFASTTTLALVLALAATPALATTGSVYFDTNGNAAAGGTLFNGTFTGVNNVGLGRNVMTFLTSGSDNSAIGGGALDDVTSGSQNIANGFQALFSDQTGSSNMRAAGLRFNSTARATTTSPPAPTR